MGSGTVRPLRQAGLRLARPQTTDGPQTTEGQQTTDRQMTDHRSRRVPVAVRCLWFVAAVSFLLAQPGCSFFSRGSDIGEPMNLIAVMPIERDEPSSGALLPGAENVVTAQIYGVLSRSPEWHFVPDLMVVQALKQAPRTGELPSR